MTERWHETQRYLVSGGVINFKLIILDIENIRKKFVGNFTNKEPGLLFSFKPGVHKLFLPPLSSVHIIPTVCSAVLSHGQSSEPFNTRR